MACNFDTEQRCSATAACKWDPTVTAGTGPLNSPCTLVEAQLQSVLLGSAAASGFKKAMEAAVSECKLAKSEAECLAGGGALVTSAAADAAKNATFNKNAAAAAAQRGQAAALLAAAAAFATLLMIM
jgi:hypothetical protein